MMPIAPLMIEHRLMERFIDLMKEEAVRLRELKQIDLEFIAATVEFFTAYVDVCHHGKEEEILFKNLENRRIAPEHKRIMEELIREHVIGRTLIERLDRVKGRNTGKDATALNAVEECLREMIELYPAHIEKEDQRFFVPVMEYFSKHEQDSMLAAMYEFDRKLVHEHYRKLVEGLEIAMKSR
ncbi:MAG: hemerythrin domain-containing protein [bacterium]